MRRVLNLAYEPLRIKINLELLVIYINDFPDSVLLLSDIIMYVDNTKMSKEIQLHTDTVLVQGDIFCLLISYGLTIQ